MVTFFFSIDGRNNEDKIHLFDCKFVAVNLLLIRSFYIGLSEHQVRLELTPTTAEKYGVAVNVPRGKVFPFNVSPGKPPAPC